MIILDVVCIIIIAILVLQGLWYGFLKGLFFLVAWVAAAAGAYFCYDLLGEFVLNTFGLSHTTTHIVCLALGFLVPFIGLNIVGRLIHGAISKTAFSIPNRILGIVLGLIKACICCTLILTVVHILPLTGSWEEGRNNSVAYDLYLKEIEFFGFDTTQPDIKGFVAGKAENAIDAAKKSAEEAADKAADETKKAATEAINNATETAKSKASQAQKKVQEKVK